MISVDDYQKLLCKELFCAKYTQNYLINWCKNYVYGYLGHENRTHETDLMLNDIYYSLTLNPKLFKFKKRHFEKWICSKDARKFMDKCDSYEDFKCNIVGNINSFVQHNKKIKLILIKLRRGTNGNNKQNNKNTSY